MKILILILLFSILSYAFSNKNLNEIYEKNFDKTKLYEIKNIGEYYFLLSSTLFTDKKAQKELKLLSKAMLLQYYKIKDKKITGLELKGFQKGIVWEKNGRLFMLSYIDKNNIKKSYTKVDNKLQNIINEEIKKLEEIKDKNLSTHTQLKELYFQNGDFEKYNEEMDKIMEMRFNE